MTNRDFYERIFGESNAGAHQSPVVKHAVEEVKTQNNGFSLEDLTDYWKISGVIHRNNFYTVDLSKTLLPSQTQDKHAEDRKEAIKNNTGFYIPSYPEFYALVSSLERNKDNPQYQDEVEEVRQFLKDSALERWPMMLTRVRYNPKGNDVVIHNYKQQDQYEIPVNFFVGPAGAILSADNAEKPVQSLLDTEQSLQEINDTYKWLTDVDSYICRINSKHKFRVNERAAGFDADSDGASLGCDGDPQNSDASLGVKFYPQGRAKNLKV